MKKARMSLFLATAMLLTHIAALPANADAPQGEIYKQDFELETVIFDHSGNSGHTGAVADETVYMQATDKSDGNKYGAFNAEKTGGQWGRCALEFNGDGITEGQINVKFRFRPNAGTFSNGGFGSVLIGNCVQTGANINDKNDARGNWLVLVDIKDGNLKTLNVNGSGSGTPLTDSSGSAAKVTQGTWYTCDAVIDPSVRSLDMKVTEAGTGKVYSMSRSALPIRANKDEWGNWPAIASIEPAKFKDIGVLSAIDIDDVEITYLPVAVSNIEFINSKGEATEYATDKTVAIRLNFSSAVENVDGKITLDGETQQLQMSDDGRSAEIVLSSPLDINQTCVLCVGEGIKSVNTNIPQSEEDKFTFTVADKNLLFAEDYEGETVSDFRPFYGSEVSCAVTEKNGNHYGKISNAWNRGGYQFDAVTSGKVHVSFDYMFDSISRNGDDAYAYVRFGHETGKGGTNDILLEPLTLLHRSGSELRYAHHKQDFTEWRIGLTSAGHWYHYDATLDIEKHSMNLTIETADGTVKINKVIPIKTSSSSTNDRYIGWPINDVFDQISFVRDINIDNIRIERTYDVPKLMADSVRILTADGQEESDLTAVAPSANQIEIDFGDKMNEESVTADSVKLTASDESAVLINDRTFDASGRVYTISFDSLKPNTAYKLTVSGEVENAAEQAMGKDFTYEFTTKSGSVTAKIDSITAHGSEVTTLEQLNGITRVNATVSNTSAKDGIAVIYLAYYGKDNAILGIEQLHIDVPVGKTMTKMLRYGVKKPTGTVCAKFFVWNGNDAAYQSSLELR